jgi:integrase
MTRNESQSLALRHLDGALASAIDLWAKGSTRPEIFDRETKLEDKMAAVARFFAFTGRHPGDVTPMDVERFRAHLEQLGRLPSTIYTGLSRVSSFYRWLLANPALAGVVSSNPVTLARPRHPRPYQSKSVKAWTDAETNAIVDTVNALADTGSVVGKRDYALLLFFLYTGLRRNEVISLDARSLDRKDGRLVIRYRRKGGKYTAREVGRQEVWDALEDYLRASKRLTVLSRGGPLWVRHDRAGGPDEPLGSRAFANNLKQYARNAGLGEVHLHQTRHTYARMVAEETGSFLETQEALDHENAATTRVYVERIAVKADKHGDAIAKRLKRSIPPGDL